MKSNLKHILIALFIWAFAESVTNAQPSSDTTLKQVFMAGVKYTIADSVKWYVNYIEPDPIPAYFQVSYCPTCAVATKEGVRVGGQNYYYSTAIFNRKKLIPFKSCWIVWGWRRK